MKLNDTKLMGQDELTRRELFQKLSPFGKLAIDASGCTGCGLCTTACTCGALMFSPGNAPDSFCLVFKPGACLACNSCIEACPEKCLSLERVLERASSETVLFEDRIVRCSGCGGTLGPQKMLDRVRGKLRGVVTCRLDLCPECRARLNSFR